MKKKKKRKQTFLNYFSSVTILIDSFTAIQIHFEQIAKFEQFGFFFNHRKITTRYKRDLNKKELGFKFF